MDYKILKVKLPPDEYERLQEVIKECAEYKTMSDFVRHSLELRLSARGHYFDLSVNKWGGKREPGEGA